MVATPVGMTAEQLLGYDLLGKRVELVRGAVVVREPVGFRHGDLTSRLDAALRAHLAAERQANGWDRARGRVATADPGFTISRNPDTVRAPDIAYVSRERYAGPMPDGFPEFAPDLAVEVRSPRDHPAAVIAKVGEWLAAGGLLVWVVDPPRQQVVVYRANGSVTVVGLADTLSGDDVLPGFAWPVAELFVDD